MKNSKIEWTHHTFNPWWGCVKVSPACAHCYPEAFAKRTGHDVWGPDKPRRFFGAKHWREPLKWNAGARARGVRERVFCASMADVFEDYQGPEWRILKFERWRLFNLIDSTPNLDWLLLTKRPENVQKMVPAHWSHSSFPSHVWIGTTVGNQEQASISIPQLLKIPAKVRFLSCEPLLGPVDLAFPSGASVANQQFPKDFSSWRKDQQESWFEGVARATYIARCGIGIHWVICGGESGPGARPMHPEWARSLRDQCQAANVPFFFKQWGDWLPWEFDEQQFNDLAPSQNGQELWNDDAPRDPLNLPKGWEYFEDLSNPTATLFQRVGKARAGRLLDGREWSEFPFVQPS